MSEHLKSSSAETSISTRVGANIQGIVDATKSGMGFVFDIGVQTIGDGLIKGMNTTGYIGGQIIRGIGTGTIEAGKSVLGGKFNKPLFDKTQKA